MGREVGGVLAVAPFRDAWAGGKPCCVRGGEGDAHAALKTSWHIDEIYCRVSHGVWACYVESPAPL